MAAFIRIELPNPGARVGIVDGPGQWPEWNGGVVLCQVADRWGTHALVLMDTGETKTCHSLNTGPGVGWHLV